MRRFIPFLLLLTIALQACGAAPEVAEAATDVPAETSTEQPEDVATEAPTEAPVLVSVDLAGPPMEVGSKYLYVDGTVLVAVPGGPFTMGDLNSADNPVREVTVSDFWIYSTKVTNSQYALCVQLGKCTPPDPANAPNFDNVVFSNFPVTGVTYAQASDYCAMVKGHLPTDAEWEKAARGPEGNTFPWGSDVPSCSLLNYGFCEGKTTFINQYPEGKSFYEAWDMSGNVREWAFDWFDPKYNIEDPISDPQGPETGTERSVRSSSYQDSANAAIAANRFSLDPELSQPDLGFRCVVEEPTVFAPWCEIVGYAGVGPDGAPAECEPKVKCNDVSLGITQDCSTVDTPFAIVTFQMSNHPPVDWSYDAPGCLEIETSFDKAKFICKDPGNAGPASVLGSCVDKTACAATCPDNYTLDGNTCKWDGSSTGGTECLPGSTFDPLSQCCTATPGTGTSFNACPAGYFAVNGICLPTSSAVPESITHDITFGSCTPPLTDEPGGEEEDGGGGEEGGGGGTCPPGQTFVCNTIRGVTFCGCQ